MAEVVVADEMTQHGVSTSDTDASATDTETDTVTSSRSLEKNRKRKERNKRPKARAAEAASASEAASYSSEALVEEPVVVEYILTHDAIDPAFADLANVFEHFQSGDALLNQAAENAEGAGSKANAATAVQGELEEESKEQMSRKKARRLKRLSIAELKQLVAKPEVVEQWDVTAADPRLLVMLKSYRNCVPVPKHWCQKRHFLQGKRGVEKPPFRLPEFIEATGIAKIRAAVMEREAGKKLKSKQKERVQPKMGKIDIDYQVLHDAFFKYQTKPTLTGHGDVYYEGKEFEVMLRAKKPGLISDELRKALQIGDTEPPPWLINMQRYGPPPSYPSLKIPGLNAPIPEGTSYGYHPGGWGKPPVDEFGRPLYGDVFGTAAVELEAPLEVTVEQELWGEIDIEEVEEEEEDDEDGTAGDDVSMADGEIEAGISSVSSAPSGIATPDSVHLRKLQNDGLNTPSNQSATGTDTPDSFAGTQKQLYQLLEQREVRVASSAFGSSHAYIVPAGGGKGGVGNPEVNLALDPKELDKLDAGTLKAKYDELRKAEQAANAPEDVTDIIEEQERKRRRKIDAAKDKKVGNHSF